MFDFDDAPDWTAHVLLYSATGSRIICDPAPTDTDEDFICFQPKYEFAISALEEMGFSSEGQPEFYTGTDRGHFRSLRREDTNIILTDEIEFYDLFRSATELAKRFNLHVKEDRIALFQAVLYGVGPENLETPQ